MLIADGIDPNELLSTMAAVKAGTKAKRAARRLNTATLMKTAKPKPGQVKAAPGSDQKSHGRAG